LNILLYVSGDTKPHHSTLCIELEFTQHDQFTVFTHHYGYSRAVSSNYCQTVGHFRNLLRGSGPTCSTLCFYRAAWNGDAV